MIDQILSEMNILDTSLQKNITRKSSRIDKLCFEARLNGTKQRKNWLILDANGKSVFLVQNQVSKEQNNVEITPLSCLDSLIWLVFEVPSKLGSIEQGNSSRKNS